MKHKHTQNQEYYDRKLVRAEQTMILLAKVSAVVIPMLLLLNAAYWAWNIMFS